MAHHDFLFTYSVTSMRDNEISIKAADKVRRKIADLDRWNKLDNVETAFVGRLYLISTEDHDKRKEAEADVRKVIRQVVEDSGEFSNVWVNIALSVDKLGKYIEFRV